MIRPFLPLNALRAFEAAARHLSFTKAASELCVTPAALSHQVKALEGRLRVPLFRRLPRGLALTDEGQTLLPALSEAFDRIALLIGRFDQDAPREVLAVAAVGTFAIGWLLPRLDDFREQYPFVDVRLFTNNNRVDLAEEGLDVAIRYGDGAWHGIEARHLLDAPLTLLCAPKIAERLKSPADVACETLLRSYRVEDWPRWFREANVAPPSIRGPVFDSSLAMVDAAVLGAGVALAPAVMFAHQLSRGTLVRPFAVEVAADGYWLTRLKAKPVTTAMAVFERWLSAQVRRNFEVPAERAQVA